MNNKPIEKILEELEARLQMIPSSFDRRKMRGLVQRLITFTKSQTRKETREERDLQIEKYLEYRARKFKSNSCGVCGGKFAKIRGRYPYAPQRSVCPTCLMEIIESTIDNLSQNNQESTQINNIK